MWGGLQNFNLWVLKQERGLHPASHFADDTPECNGMKSEITVSELAHLSLVHDLLFWFMCQSLSLAVTLKIYEQGEQLIRVTFPSSFAGLCYTTIRSFVR
jgi:hypothetical protein